MTQADATHDDEAQTTETKPTTVRHGMIDVDSFADRAAFTNMQRELDATIRLADNGFHRTAAKSLRSHMKTLDRLADSLIAEAEHDE